MNIKLNFSQFGSIFAVPSVVVDKHIKLAGSVQLKVLLWFLRNSQSDIKPEDISKALGIPAADITDALQYWIQNGILLDSDGLEAQGAPQEVEKKEPVKTTEPAPPPPPAIRPTPQKPTPAEVAKLVAENPEISFLLNESQLLLERPISPGEAQTLVHIYLYYGMPTPVILTLIKYAQSIGKANMAYIERVSYDWSKEGIDTPEKAERKLEQFQSTQKHWYQLVSAFSLEKRSPSPREQQYVNRWFEEWGFSIDMIRKAYEHCVDNTGKLSFNYMNKVLEKWHKSGIKTPKDVDQQQKQFEESKKKKTTDKKASYDLDEFKRSMLYDTPVYKRRDKGGIQ